MNHKIDTNIPIPSSRKDTRSYPFKELEVGQSFLVAQESDETKTQVRERTSAAMTWAKRSLGRDFCTRTVDGGIRVWRLK